MTNKNCKFVEKQKKEKMRREKEGLIMTDGVEVILHAWLPDMQPRYVLVVCHGMKEFAERYDEFATFLCANGVALYAHDQRGHGETAVASENLGFLAERHGFGRVVDDLREVLGAVSSRYPAIKVFLLGHSFGSFVSQGYMERYGREHVISGCLLSGTAGPRLALVSSARVLAGFIRLFRGARHRSALLKWMVFGRYNLRVESPESENSWLSRDKALIRNYDADPKCTFVPTVSFFCDMFEGLFSIHTSRMMAGIPKNLPVFLFFGSEDPVGEYGSSPRKLYEAYRRMGMADVSMHEYEGGRHEMLNETNRADVMSELLSLLDGWSVRKKDEAEVRFPTLSNR